MNKMVNDRMDCKSGNEKILFNVSIILLCNKFSKKRFESH